MPNRRTAKQRAALRKAQAASARKRRRRRNVAIGIGALAVGTGIGIAGAKYGKHIKLPKRRIRGSTKPMLALPAGKSAPPTRARQKRVATKAAKVARARSGAKNVVASKNGVFKFSATGKGQYLKRNRPAYDASRRSSHVSKPRTKYGPRRL